MLLLTTNRESSESSNSRIDGNSRSSFHLMEVEGWRLRQRLKGKRGGGEMGAPQP